MSCLGVYAERGFSESGGGNSHAVFFVICPSTLLAVGIYIPVASLVEVLNR